MSRDVRIDIIRGILIVSVVVAHFREGIVHDIIFLFHMPLFFILTGFLLKYEKVTDVMYLKQRTVKLLIPYLCYMVLDLLFVRQTFSLKDMIKLLWGGRAIAGTYWYITCLLFTLFMFSVLVKNFHKNTVKHLILLGGV